MSNKKRFIALLIILGIVIIGISIICLFVFREKTYDMSNINFESKTVVYDGNYHELTISGELPDGVSVEYTENKLQDVGLLEVIATFKGEKGYKKIPSLKAELRIIPKEITIKVNDSSSIIYAPLISNGYEVIEGSLNDKDLRNLDLRVTFNDTINNNIEGIYANTIDIEYNDNANYILNVILGTYTILDDGCYELYFHNLDGTIDTHFVVKNQLFEQIPTPPSIIGYIYNWDYDFNNPITDDTHIYLKSKPIDYFITYHLNDGFNDSLNPNSYTIEDKIILNDCNKKGYIFEGWYLEETHITKIDVIEKGTYENIEIYAKFVPSTYHINYYINGKLIDSNLLNPNSFTIEDEILLNDYDKVGYIFSGWYLEETLNTKIDVIEKGTYKDINLYSEFVPKEFNVNYYIDGKLEKTNKVLYDSLYQIVRIENSNSGYEVTSWLYEDISYSPLQEITYNYLEDINLEGVLSLVNHDFEYEVVRGNAHITRYHGNQKELIIPEMAFVDSKYYNVTTINEYAFYDLYDIQSIYIPKEITYVDKYAFANCGELTIYCENNLEEIEWADEWNFYNRPVYWNINNNNFVSQNEFQYVLDLQNKVGILTRYLGINKNAVIPDIVEYNEEQYIIKTIGSSSFSNSSQLISLEMSNSIAKIESSAFINCYNLERITLSSNINEIGNKSFFNCLSLQNIYLPNSIEVIEDNAFNGCSKLSTVTIGENTTNIGENAFYNCSSLSKLQYNGTIDEWVTIEFSNVYSNPMYYSKNIYIIDGLSYVEVTDVDFSINVTKVNSYSFYNMVNLETMRINQNITTIEQNAIYNTSKLIVYTEFASAPSTWHSSFTSNDIVIYYGVNFNNLIKQNNIEYLIDNTTKKAIITKYKNKDRMFDLNETLTIEDPSSMYYQDIYDIAEIGEKACYKLNTLEVLILNNKITTINNYAFWDCANILFINIPDSVIYIGSYAFGIYSGTQLYYESNSLNNFNSKWYVLNNSVSSSDHIHECVTPLLIDYETNCAYEYSSVNNDYTLTRYFGNQTEFTVPTNIATSLYDNYSVSNIASYAFSYNKHIQNIVIQDNIVEIYERTFSNCTNLKYIALPSTIQKYNDNCFSSCNNLKNIIYEGNIENWLNIIFENEFSYPTRYANNITMLNENNELEKLTSIYIPRTTTTFSTMFFGFEQIKNVYFGGTINDWMNIDFSSIYNNPMYYAEHLFILDENNEYTEVTSVVVPTIITEIKKYTFASCEFIESIYLHSDIENYGIDAFKGSSSLNDVYFGDEANNWIHQSFVNLYASPLSNYANLYVYDENDEYYKLTNLDIYDQVINDYTLNRCISLETIYISLNTNSIGKEVFGNDDDYIVLVEQPKDQFTSINSYPTKGLWDVEKKLFIDNGLYYFYDDVSNSATIVNYIGNDSQITVNPYISINSKDYIVTSINSYAFYKCTSIKSIILPDTIEELNESCFSFCSNLEEILLPSSLKIIPNYTFNNCTKLKSVTLNNSLEKIGSYAFNNCQSLANIRLNNSLNTLGDYVFNSCSNLMNINIPNSITTFGNNIFRGCSKVSIYCESKPNLQTSESTIFGQYLHLYYNVSTQPIINDDNYIYQINVENNTATLIACKVITETMILPSTIEYENNIYSINAIAMGCFRNNTVIKSIVLPKYLDRIESYQFENCSNLIRVICFRSIVNIGTCSFSKCSKLNDIYLSDSILTIENNSFNNCNNLFKIVVYKDFTIANPFNGCSNIVVKNEY